MSVEELQKKIDNIMLKIVYLKNNISMSAEVICMANDRSSDTSKEARIKLYDLERIGPNIETTFNYIDSELGYLFDELNNCLSLLHGGITNEK